MISPAISIIVPVYGVEKYLDRCVRSLLAQDFADYEVILVDDGSPDCCPQMCDEWAKRSEKIRVVHKENGGLTSARLVGYKASRGEFISFIDSDDFIEPDMMSSLYHTCVSEQADLALCGWFTDNDANLSQPHLLPISETLNDKNAVMKNYFLPLCGSNPASHMNLPGFMWLRLYSRRHIQERMFVSEREYITEDILFNMMYAMEIERVAFVNKPLYHYCYNGTSLTNKFRDGVFPKMLARYHYCCKLCEEAGMTGEAALRLRYNLLSATAFSVLNACKIPDFSKACAELKTIFSHPEIKRLMGELSWNGLTTQQRVIKLSYITHAYYPLYRYLRWRMK
jgi:glycosyltransferase involved in cell wall biosynthesis